MKMIQTKNLLACVAAAVATSAAHAGIDSASFNAVDDAAISTAGALDWGFVTSGPGDSGLFDSNLTDAGLSLDNTPFGSVTRDEGDVITTVSGSSSIGTVTLTEGAGGAAGTNTVDAQSNASPYTFDGNATAGSYGNFAPTEQDIWQIAFNDLGVGTFTITLYLGHTNTGRSFDMDVVLSDGGAPIEETTAFGPLSTLESTVGFAGGAAFTYDITVTTTTPGADLTLTHGGTGGSSGGALLAGYLVTGDAGPALPGDTDGDGDVDDADLGTSFSNYTGPLAPGTGGKTAATGDTDGDGDVDDADLGTSFSNYTGPLAAAAVPEPTSLALLGLGGLLVARRRR